MILEVIVFIFCTILFVVSYFHFKWAKEDAALGVPGLPRQFFLGNLNEMRKEITKEGDVIRMTGKWIQDYGSVVQARILQQRMWVITDPKILELIANNPKVEKPQNMQMLKSWLGDSLVITNGERWSKLRKLITPAFHFQILEDFIKVFDDQAKILTEKLGAANGNVIDVPTYLCRFAMDVICETAMGIRVGAQENDNVTADYRQAVKDVFHHIQQRMMNPLLVNDSVYQLTGTYRAEKKCTDIIHAFVNGVIEKRRNEIIQKQKIEVNQNEISDAKKRVALLDLLLQAKMDGKPLTNDDIRGEVNTFMFAGHDTTTSATQMFLYLMAKNPIEQEKLYDEIKANVIETGEPISIRLINSLNYLDMCLKESLRIFPPLMGFTRETKVPLQSGNVKISAGDLIIVAFYWNHHNAKYFPEPEKFIPERFDDAVSIEQRNPYIYTPFSFGLRNCIGQRFAVLEMKTMLINVISKFKIELDDPDFVPQMDYSAVAKSKNGVWLKFIKRE